MKERQNKRYPKELREKTSLESINFEDQRWGASQQSLATSSRRKEKASYEKQRRDSMYAKGRVGSQKAPYDRITVQRKDREKQSH